MATDAPLGHLDAAETAIDPISGPIEKISADTFAVDLKRETVLDINVTRYELVFAVTHTNLLARRRGAGGPVSLPDPPNHNWRQGFYRLERP